ncbi:fused MFS/spermidine synthase [archaeon]|nr:fused MFS/spermidine synthase [archaeon]
MNRELKITIPKFEFGLKQLLLLAFALSGMTVLIYEVVWIRPLQLVFGSTIYAVSTMLTTLMIGFALGSYLFKNKADESKNPVLLFAILEFGIGLYGLIILALFSILPSIYLSLLFVPGFQFIQFALCFTVLIIPATLMGAIWPVVNKAYVTETEKLGQDVGKLYSFNSLGSALGPIAAGFLLIPLFGISNTGLFAASLNLLIAFSVFMYLKVKK